MDIYFIRLYKMVLETCRSVMWEMLLQMVQHPGEIIDFVAEISKNTKTPVLKELLEFWKENNTTTPIETDFDISSLCMVVRFVLKRKIKSQPDREVIIKTIDFLKEKRNNLAHRGCLSMSDEEYNNDYKTIREHVDFLESVVNKNYKPGINCKWIRRPSSKYLNKIDRIHHEYIDPDAKNELENLIKKWRNEISLLQAEDDEQEIENQMKQKEQSKGLLVPYEDLNELKNIEIEDSSRSEPYDQDSVEDTLTKMEDTVGLVDENKVDMNEQTKKEHAKQQATIETLKETIVKIQEKEKRNSNQPGTVEEAVYGTEKEHAKQQATIETLKETIVKIQEKEKRNSNQPGTVEEAVYGTEKEHAKQQATIETLKETIVKIQEKEKRNSNQPGTVEEAVYGTKKEHAKQQATIETLKETIVKIQEKEKRNSNQPGTVEEAVYDVDKKDNSLETDRLIRYIDEAIESADLHVKKCKKEYEDEIKSQRINYEEILSFEKMEKDLIMKQVDEKYESKVNINLLTAYDDIRMKMDLEKEDIEKKFQDVIAALEKEYEEKKSNSLKTYKEKIDMIMHDKEYIITKIKEKFQNKILSI